MSWIPLTLFAALMQSIRTAGQKQIGTTFSPMANTCVRFLFGLPFAALYFLLLFLSEKTTTFAFSTTFFLYATVAALSQIFGTVLQVKLLGMRNFATGTVFVKSEVMLTAMIGLTFFDDQLGLRSWVGIALCTIGIVFLGLKKQKLMGLKTVSGISVLTGLGAGLGFSLASLFIRKASLSLDTGFVFSAAACLLVVLMIQATLMTLYLFIFEKQQWQTIASQKGISLFIGATSVAGSIGWFTAMTLVQASFVRALGQVEVIFALLITYIFFREKPKMFEWIGISTVTIGVFFTIL